MKLSLRHLLSLSSLMTLLLFLLLSLYVGGKAGERYDALNQAEETLMHLQLLTRLEEALAAERGLQALNAHETSPELHQLQTTARQTTDRYLKVLPLLPRTTLSQAQREGLDQLIEQLKTITRLRQQADGFDDYARLINTLILLQKQLILTLPDRIMQNRALSMIELIQAREQAALERGKVMASLTRRRMTAEDYVRIAGHIQQSEQFLQSFYLAAGKNEAEALRQALSRSDLNAFYAMRRQLANHFTLQQMLGRFLGETGYGGFIHHYKNYLLRGDARYMEQALRHYNRAMTLLITTREHLPLGLDRQGALLELQQVFSRYALNLIKISSLRRQGLSPMQIDRQVRVDDAPALQAIDRLRQLPDDMPPGRWWGLTSHRIDLMTAHINRIMNALEHHLSASYDELSWEIGRNFLVLGVALVLLLIISAYGAGRMHRLRHLVQQLLDMVANRHYEPLPVQGHDEVASLTHTFNQLVEERKEHEKTIWRESNLDALTQLPNRVYLHALLDYALKDAHRLRQKIAVLFLDLDGFKEVNDTLGHRAGDELLQVIAQRLREMVRENDILARLGGDEFVMVLTHLQDETPALQIARKIIEAVRKPVQLETGDQAHVSASIGLAFYPDDGEDVETLIKHADMAMYHAKDHGKNRFARFQPSWSEHLAREHQIQTLLAEAAEMEDFARQGFSLHYQPIVRTTDERISHMEVLLRWQSAQLGHVSPADFIPVAERSRLIVPLGNWVLREALEQADRWKKRFGQPVRMAINISPVQAQDGFSSLREQLLRLEREGLQTQLISLELTESLLLEDAPQTRAALERLHRLGYELFLDDFGTGYASLSYLKRYPFDALKIDRAFIMDLLEDEQDRELVDAIIAMAKGLRLAVVAEGVETAEQLDYLRQRGCDYVQGYHLARPMAPEEAESWLDRHLSR